MSDGTDASSAANTGAGSGAGTSGDENALFDELRWVHAMIRRDLQSCRTLAEAVAAGERPEAVRSGIESMTTRGVLFQLRIGCLRHCQLVHSHHGGEDAHLFPAVRAGDPELTTIVDRLQSEHREISDLLDAVENAANGLGLDEPTDRDRLVTALATMADSLLRHLAFEESVLQTALRGWTFEDLWPPASR
jgi:hypothetical protein